MSYDLAALSNSVLMREVTALVAQDRRTTARLLAHLAEVDFRRLYLQAGYPTMRDYCIKGLRFSEDAAYKRIQGARVGRQFPILFEALEKGWLHLGAVRLLAPHLTETNAKSLVSEATHRTCYAIEARLAELFPQAEELRLDEGIAALGSADALATWQAQIPNSRYEPTEGTVSTPQVPSRTMAPSVPTRVAPIAAQRFALQVTISQETHDKLREVQDLLSHVVPPNDVASVLDRALDALKEKLRKRKFGTGRAGKPSASRRYIPAQVKTAVWQRDGGRCTFVAPDGQRCEATKHLEFDHVIPVARGGKSVVGNLRLRCRGHNQLEAERILGKQFMEDKRT